MSERAVAAVVTDPGFLSVATAKLCFVLVRVIHFFNYVVREGAKIPVWTRLFVFNELTFLWPVGAQLSTSVLLFVVVHPAPEPVVVLVLICALDSLEYG